MKAIVHDPNGSPQNAIRLGEVGVPRIGEHDVLVDVHASSVAGHDAKLVRGEPLLARLVTGRRSADGRVLGRDLAGRVRAVGGAVTALRPGDDVFGWCDGAFAERVAVPASRLVRKPSGLTCAQAAVVPVSGSVALRAVRDVGRVTAGQRVLVIGASGRVGTFAVQIAKALGATVTGVCSTTSVDLVRSIGADHVLDYTLHDIADRSPRHDVVIDLAGGRSLTDLRGLAADDGTVVLVSAPRQPVWARSCADVRRAVAAAAIGSFKRQRFVTVWPAERRSDLTALSDLIQAGLLTPVVSAHFTLAEVPAALRHFAPGHSRGNVAITI